MYSQTPAEAVERADLVVLCAPVGANADIAAAIAGSLHPGAIVTDVGSQNRQSSGTSAHIPAGVHLVPGHPVAGTKSGPDHGFAELFSRCAFNPPPGTDGCRR